MDRAYLESAIIACEQEANVDDAERRITLITFANKRKVIARNGDIQFLVPVTIVRDFGVQ